MKKLFALFVMLLIIGSTQAQGSFKNYENDKYRFSFSYPGEYLLEKANDEEWVIHKADNSWVIMFKIMHLQGKSYDNYVNSLSTSIINAYFKELSAKFGSPEKGAFRQCLIGGFEFDKFSSQYLAGGTAMEKLTNSMIIYLDIFRKTSHTSFIPDGIIIYSLGPTINFDNSKLTTQLINTFEKTIVFKEAIVTKTVVTTVAKKKPVIVTPVVKKPVTIKPVVQKPATGKFTDSRDGGETYHTVMIGNQNWMAENLQVKNFQNGDAILNVTTEKEWEKAGKENKPAWCYYNFDSSYRDYGKLYNWYAVNDVRGLAAQGWHIPAENEWAKLITTLGGKKEALIKMRTAKGWSANTEGSNTSGFGALPGGCCTYGGTFGAIKNIGYWWSSTPHSSANWGAYSFIIVYNTALKTWDIETLVMDKFSGYSVRCVQN
jgi:uncharacterized protein (TIGR02145 family)